MTLAQTFAAVRPGIIALASRRAVRTADRVPVFPEIIGTGFIADGRGVAITNRHVSNRLRQLLPHPQTGTPSAFAILFDEVVAGSGMHTMRAYCVGIRRYDELTSFTSSGSFYGEQIPDIAFIQLNVCDVPALELAADLHTLVIGMPIATAGFPLGEEALTGYGRVLQFTPMLRHGIISSLYPFPCPSPHGFTIDIMTQGGESGSPIFLTDSPKVVGLLYAGFNNSNITIALPSTMLSDALGSYLSTVPLDVSDIPTLQSLRELPGGDEQMNWDVIY